MMSKHIISLFIILSLIFGTFTVLASEPQIEISENANISLFSGVLNTDELPVLNNNEAKDVVLTEQEFTKPTAIQRVENKLRYTSNISDNSVIVENNSITETINVNSRNSAPLHSEYRVKGINGKDSYALQNQTGRTTFVGDNLGTEYIDPLTGNLIITETDLVLPGVDGLDLRIERYYSSAEAELYNKTAGAYVYSKNIPVEPGMYIVSENVYDSYYGTTYTYQYVYEDYDEASVRRSEILTRDNCYGRYTFDVEISEAETSGTVTVDYIYTSELNSTSYQRMRNNIGAGWSWSFPSVQVIKDNYLDTEEIPSGLYYHDGKGNVLEVDYDGNNCEFTNYTGGDIEFEAYLDYDTSICTNSRIDYIVNDADGREYYFGIQGEIRVIRDRFGNKIEFWYDEMDFYGNSDYPVINMITDTVGRRVWIDYTTEDDYEYMTLTVTSPVETERELVLTYKRRMIDVYMNGSVVSTEPVLETFTNTIGEVTSYYPAEINESSTYLQPLKFTFADKFLDSQFLNYTTGYSQNATYLLGFVLRPHSLSTYNYERCTRNLGRSGVSEAFRVSERYDYELNVNTDNTIRMDYIKNVKAYSYGDDDYTGYPNYHSISAIPENYAVCSTTEQQSGIWKSRSYYKIGDTVLLKSEGTTYENPVGEHLYVAQEVEEFSGKYPLKTKITYSNGNYSYNSYVYSEYADGYYNKAQGKPLVVTKEIDWEALLSGNYEKYLTRYEYNNNGFLTQKIWYQDEDVPLYETYSYNSNKRLSSVTNADDVTTSYTYEYTNGKVSKKTAQSYNDGETLTIEEYYTSATSYAFPSTIKKIVTSNGETKTDTTTYTYDMLLGVVTSETDTNGNITYYEYDNLGRVTKIIYPSYLTYDSINTKNTRILPIQEINYGTVRLSDYSNISDTYAPLQVQEIQQTTLYYDVTTDNVLENKDLTYVADEINYYMGSGEHIRNEILDTVNNTNAYITTDYIYDDYYNSITVIDAQGNETVTYYDGLGREVKIEDIFDNYEIIEYNISGDSVGFKAMSYFVPCDNRNTKENISVNTYDRWGRCVNTKAYEVYPQNYVETKYTYDLSGNVIGVIDPKGTRNADGYTVSYTYDRLNRVKTTKNAKNEIIENYYDNYGNITEQYISDGKSSKRLYSREYDGEGKIISDKDNSNNKNVYTYNELGQLINITDKAEKENNYVYNELGVSDRISTVKPEESITLRMYEYLNPYGANTVYSLSGIYDEDSESYLVANDETAYYTYSPTGKITRYRNEYTVDTLVDDVYFEPCISYEYDEIGNTTKIQLGYYKEELIDEEITGVSYGDFINYEYNKNRLSKVSFFEKDVLYEFYNDGKLKSVTYPTLTDGSVLKSEYTYDGLSRLKTLVNKKGETVLSSYSYTYDNNGNIQTVSETVNGVTKNTSYTYDELNRIASVIGDKGVDSYYEYDYRGNRKVNFEQTDFLSEENAEYYYDEFDKLTYANVGEDETTSLYNENGYRYFKQENTNYPSYYSYDTSGRLMSKSALIISENEILMYPCKQYIWGAGNVIAQVDSIDNIIHYYLYNGHGDVVQIVDTAGTVVNNYDYDVWGNFITKQETIDNPFTYFGQTFDETTGLYYLRARYYDPQTGRFIQQDPAEDGYNWYVYGNQNPVLYVDYTGESVMLAYVIIGAIVGGVVGGFAGAYVSKQTTGDVTATGVVVGVLGGATLGGLLGYGMYAFGASISASGVVSTLPGVYKTLDKGINFTATTVKHMNETGRQVPIQVLIEAIKYGKASPDPQGTSAMMYYIEMVKNGKTYTLEVLYDKVTNTIMHFLYR